MIFWIQICLETQQLMNVTCIDDVVLSLKPYLINMLQLPTKVSHKMYLLLEWLQEFCYLKDNVVILTVFSVKHVGH